jgi:transcriptional regulator with XRE-family HTH domain
MASDAEDRSRINPGPRPSFGIALKDWRARRRLSQLDLALAAGVSARHVAFLETGRARPSREMVIALAAAMDVPLRCRNELMQSAGFAPVYQARPLSDDALAPIRSALDLMLMRHDPYPGILLDRHWNVLQANTAAAALFAQLLGDSEEPNLVRRLLANPLAPRLITNWSEVMRDLLSRLRLEAAQAGGDAELEALAALVAANQSPVRPHAIRDAAANPFMGIKFVSGEHEIALFSAMVEFGTSEDITVRDLRLELFFPADRASAEALQTFGAGTA